MANLHRILGRGAIRWRIVDPWPGPVTQGLLSMEGGIAEQLVERVFLLKQERWREEGHYKENKEFILNLSGIFTI